MSDTQIIVDVFDRPEGQRENVSGSAIDGTGRGVPDGERMPDDVGVPDGKQASDDNNPGNVSPGGIEGRRRPESASGDAVRGQDRKSESKTISLDGDTKIYKQQGEEKTEITVAELELDSMVEIEIDGDMAVSVTGSSKMSGRVILKISDRKKKIHQNKCNKKCSSKGAFSFYGEVPLRGAKTLWVF
ncbi:MAG: hypothetical protein J1F22_04450 [Lachnospiraceae bacterium]|nr:hypothetical protein [Lachnospiraceae bacterium]